MQAQAQPTPTPEQAPQPLLAPEARVCTAHNQRSFRLSKCCGGSNRVISYRGHQAPVEQGLSVQKQRLCVRWAVPPPVSSVAVA